ncbi:MAG: RDD family protein [Bryobacteraceae bacterium]
MPRPQLVTGLPSAPAESEYQYQASLFGPQAVPREQSDPQPRQPLLPQRRQRRDRSLQPSLFDATQETRTLATSVEAAVYCNAPVAIAQHRVVAATIDFGLALLGVALFAATFWFGGAPVALNKVTIPIYLGCMALIGLLYRLLFWAGNNDTVGLQMTGLLLLNFDGRRPTRKQRLYRIGGGLISVIATGLGLVWALFDEERLTWHDYISKTFPTPRS